MKTLPAFLFVASLFAGGAAYAHGSHMSQSPLSGGLVDRTPIGGDKSFEGQTHDAKFVGVDKLGDRRIDRREIERLRRLEAELLRGDRPHERRSVERELREIRALIARLEKGGDLGGVSTTGWDIVSNP